MNKATTITVVFALIAVVAAAVTVVAVGWLPRTTASQPATPQPTTAAAKDPLGAIQLVGVESIRIEDDGDSYSIIPTVQLANTSSRGVKLERGSFYVTVSASKKNRGEKAKEGESKKDEAKKEEKVGLGAGSFDSLEIPPADAEKGLARLELRIPAGPKTPDVADKLFKVTNFFSDSSYDIAVELAGSADLWSRTKSGENVEGWVKVGTRRVRLTYKPAVRNTILLK